jgi:hypothetical protein
MRHRMLMTAVVLIATAIGVGEANSAVGVAFDIGNVSVGYTDGYWDNQHHWHHWAHRADAAHYRAAHGDQYHAWRHDDPNHH